MKKLTVLLLLTSLFGYSQIDYKGLVRNLEDVTINTDIKAYFKGLPIESDSDGIAFNDERFLRFYGVIINKVKFSDRWGEKKMDITAFNEKEDYVKIKSKLIEAYGEPDTDFYGRNSVFSWRNDTNDIRLSITFQRSSGDPDVDENDDFVKRKFESFDSLTIIFKEH